MMMPDSESRGDEPVTQPSGTMKFTKLGCVLGAGLLAIAATACVRSAACVCDCTTHSMAGSAWERMLTDEAKLALLLEHTLHLHAEDTTITIPIAALKHVLSKLSAGAAVTEKNDSAATEQRASKTSLVMMPIRPHNKPVELNRVIPVHPSEARRLQQGCAATPAPNAPPGRRTGHAHCKH